MQSETRRLLQNHERCSVCKTFVNMELNMVYFWGKEKGIWVNLFPVHLKLKLKKRKLSSSVRVNSLLTCSWGYDQKNTLRNVASTYKIYLAISTDWPFSSTRQILGQQEQSHFSRFLTDDNCLLVLCQHVGPRISNFCFWEVVWTFFSLSNCWTTRTWWREQ